MPIEFLDLLGGGGWEPLRPDVGPGARWSEGGALSEAPVDVAATFDGAMWRATRIDPTFGLTGVRMREGFRVPQRHHDQSLLLIAFGGSLRVTTTEGDAGEDVEVGPGQFCIIEADTQHSLTAGPQGATFLTSWPQGVTEAETCWYPDPGWVRATGRTGEGT